MKNLNLFPGDTTNEASYIKFSILRKIGIYERAVMAIQLSDDLRSTIKDGIRLRRPDYNDNDVELEAFRLAIGENLFCKAYTERIIKGNESERFSGKNSDEPGKR